MSTVIFGTVASMSEAERIIADLRRAGFVDTDISVLTTGQEPPGSLPLQVLPVRGIGDALATGPIVAALEAAAIGTAGNGVIGALVGMGMSEPDAERYDARLRVGRVCISVYADDLVEHERALAVLRHGAAQHLVSATEE